MKEFLPKSAAKMADCLMADDDAGIRDGGRGILPEWFCREMTKGDADAP